MKQHLTELNNVKLMQNDLKQAKPPMQHENSEKQRKEKNTESLAKKKHAKGFLKQ